MAMAYSSGLKVKANDLVRKTRKLPLHGDILVNQGDAVSFDTVVAKTAVKGESVTIDAAASLKVEPEDLKMFLVKKIGDKLEKNELIAKRVELFGLSKSFCRSPTDGKIELISDFTGQIVISKPDVPVEILAYVPGKIVQILPKEGVIVEAQGAFIQGIFGIGGETHGALMMAVASPDEVLTDEKITPACSGKILVGGSLVTCDALTKAAKVGAKGIVVGGLAEEDLIKFLGYEVGVAITGHETVGITLIVTEGFSKMKMANRTFELLKKYEGKEAAINGTTQIRAGVIRPEIIIPLEKADLTKKETEEDVSTEGVKTGMRVRVICNPYFGALGHIVSLPVELQKVETESHLRVFELKLDDGTQVTIPRANIEIIEE